MKAPVYNIDPQAFWEDPYPDLKTLRQANPVAFVPELGATLITRRSDIFTVEKKIEYFSSVQPEGLMTKLMGQNLMRKDGEAHMSERKAIFPTVSPKTVKMFGRLSSKLSLTEFYPKYGRMVPLICLNSPSKLAAKR